MATLKQITALMLWVLMLPETYCQLSGPKPGDIYKEFVLHLKNGDNWRVTDPVAAHSGARDFLPNPVMTMQINDLDGAVRAEALMDINKSSRKRRISSNGTNR